MNRIMRFIRGEAIVETGQPSVKMRTYCVNQRVSSPNGWDIPIGGFAPFGDRKPCSNCPQFNPIEPLKCHSCKQDKRIYLYEDEEKNRFNCKNYKPHNQLRCFECNRWVGEVTE